MKPIIAVSANFLEASWDRPFYKGKPLQYVERSMATWIRSGGALPVILPDLDDVAALVEGAERLDGLVLTGGADVSPRSYGEEPLREAWAGDAERDAYEIGLLRAFLEMGKPVLGVCRGHQILNVAYGGTLHQDLVEQDAASHVHRDAEVYDRLEHPTRLVEGSWFAELYGVPEGVTNSVHHQGIKDLGAGLEIGARSDDGVIEAVRDPAKPFAIGIQWHPEWMEAHRPGDLAPAPLLRAFLDACRGAERPGGPRADRRAVARTPDVLDRGSGSVRGRRDAHVVELELHGTPDGDLHETHRLGVVVVAELDVLPDRHPVIGRHLEAAAVAIQCPELRIAVESVVVEGDDPLADLRRRARDADVEREIEHAVPPDLDTGPTAVPHSSSTARSPSSRSPSATARPSRSSSRSSQVKPPRPSPRQIRSSSSWATTRSRWESSSR